MWILIQTEGIVGEENITITEISKEDVDILTPLLLRIQENEGWFHTGDFIETIDHDLWKEYGYFEGWRILELLLPRPISGIRNIVRALLWEEDPMSLYMK